MPPSTVPSAEQGARARRSVAADSAVAGSSLVPPDAVDVGEVHQLGGPDRLGDGAGGGVGVDVVGLPGGVAADGGHHRDEVLGQQPVEQVGVDRGDVADEAELRGRGPGADEAGVLAGDADRQRPVDVDGRDDVPVDLADQHHAGDVEGLGVGDPQAVDELGHLAEPGHQLADLRAAAVDDEGSHPDRAHEHDVGGERRQRRRAPSSAVLAAPARALPPYLTTTTWPQNRRM